MESDISRRRSHAAHEKNAVYTERRRALMKAAAETFREQGLDGSSLNDIARRAAWTAQVSTTTPNPRKSSTTR